MSGYQYGHGQWPQPPPQFAQYEYTPASNQSQYPYQQPPYQDSQHQAYYGEAQTTQNAQASQAAFDHNAQAPVLNLGVNSAGSRSPNAVGGEMSWSQAFGGAPAAATPSLSYNPSAPPYQHQPQQQQQQQQHYQDANSRTPTGYQQQNYGHQQQYSQQQYTPQIYQQPLPPPPPPQHQQPYSAPSYPSVEQGQASEEGELSDDMDDIYDPEAPADPALYPAAQAPSSTSSQDAPVQPTEAYLQPASPEMPGAALGQAAVDMPSRDVSVIDTQDDAFYDDDEDEPGEIKSTGNGMSASDAADADVEDMDYSDSATNKSSAAAAAEAAQDRAVSYSPRLSPGHVEDKAARPEDLNGAANSHGTHQQVTALSTAAAGFGTVDEAKKKAQQAILRLIRYDVNYQTFVDEGVDGQVVKSLFTELGLKIDSLKTTDGTTSPAVQTPAEAAPSSSQEAAASDPAPTTADGSASKKEERKDRIARLLALKKAAKPAPAPTPTPAQPVPAGPASKTDVKSEKARLLQKKLEALKQMNEKRATAAAKAAAEATAASQTISAALPLSAPTHHPLPPRPATTTSSFTSLPTTAPAVVDVVNSRKRPVAADFGDFSNAQVNAYKRPYGIARQESTLVIDVSDDEPSQGGHDEGEYDDEGGDDDDDEDVEMEIEIESADEAVSPVTNFNGAKKSSRVQPPTAPASMIARAKDDEYARKMRQIEDMKRKIAEIEAKKHHGTSTGSVTPVTGGHGTPPEPETADSTNSRNNSHGRNFDAAQIVRPPPQPMRRITSTGELSGPTRTGGGGGTGSDGDDLPIRLPKRGDVRPSPSPLSSRASSLREERARAASVQLPRVEASLQEKMFKLRLLQDKVKTLQFEISDGIAEKQRLTEDLEDLDTESEAPVADAVDDSRAGSLIVVEDSPAVADSPAAQPSVEEAVQQPMGEAAAEAEPVSESGLFAADVDMDVPAEVKGVVETAAPADAADETDETDEADANLNVEADEYEPILSGDEQGSESAPMSVASSPYEPEDVEMEGAAESWEDGEIGEEEDEGEGEEEEDEEEEGQEEASDEDEEMMVEDGGDVFIIDDGEPTDAASTPAVEEARAAAEAEVAADVVDDAAPPSVAPTPATVAAAKAPAPSPASTSSTSSTSKSASTFTAYDSPLQYFRSYRFHPQYKAQVAGGLKSLTYSGKIRDDIQLCPSESESETCSNPACPFQHFSSIMPQDDQILVELGRSDEYTGEQQSRFVDGLKAVLKQVREDQVRDFDTIADAIIEFRRKFLADETRILANLGGTSV